MAIPQPTLKSMEGKYFLGQSGPIEFGPVSVGWASLVNPTKSNRVLYVNVATVTNMAKESIFAVVLFNADLPGDGQTSRDVTPGNTALCPLPCHRVDLRYGKGRVSCGARAFPRIVNTDSTQSIDGDGKFIIPPGGNWTIQLSSPPSSQTSLSAIVAFGWWEE